jgi:hypothetical protein
MAHRSKIPARSDGELVRREATDLRRESAVLREEMRYQIAKIKATSKEIKDVYQAFRMEN